MKFYETVEVFLPVEMNDDELKNIALNYKQYLKENDFEDNTTNFTDYYYDDTSNEYFYNFLFEHDIDFDITDCDIEIFIMKLKDICNKIIKLS